MNEGRRLMKRNSFLCFGLVALWFSALSASAWTSHMELAVSLPAGTSPRGIAVGSLSGNGTQNLIVANFGSPTFIGQSTPLSLLGPSSSNLQIFSPSPQGLQLTATVPTASSPRGVALFGLGGRSQQAIFVTAYDSNLLQVFSGKGGGWEKVDEAPTLKMPVGIAAGLTRAGGVPFVAVADYGANSLSIYPLKDGKLGQRIDIPVDGGPIQVAIGDLNGRGTNQIAVVCLTGGKVDLLSLASKGREDDLSTYTVNQTIPMPHGSSPSDLKIVDLNNDGLSDLVVTDFEKNGVLIYLQQNDGSLLAQPELATSGSHPNGFTVADLDGNGKKDIVVANRDSDSIDIFQSTGSQYHLAQTLKTSDDLQGSFGPVEVGVMDTLGKGSKDLVISHMRSNTLKVIAGVLEPGLTPTSLTGSSGSSRTSFSETTTFCYPNPTHEGSVKFSFNLEAPSPVFIQVYDLNGEKVWSQQLGEGETQSGVNTVPWSVTNQGGQNLASGLYVYCVSVGNQTITKKIAVLH